MSATVDTPVAPHGTRSERSNLTIYVSARATSQLGDMMVPIAAAAGLLASGVGPTGLGLVLAAWFVPFIGLMLVGGALADHFRPKPLLIVADLVRFGSMGLTCLEFADGQPTLWRLVLLQLVTGAAGALFEPGSKGLVPEIAAERPARAYAMLRISESMVTLAGPALAGLLLGAGFSAATVIGVDAVTYLVSAVLIALVRVPARVRRRGRPPVLRDLRAGWREFRARRWICQVIGVYMVIGLVTFGPYQVLSATILIADHDPRTFGLLQAAFGAGAVAGGLLGLRLHPKRRLRTGALAIALWMPALWLIAAGAPVPAIAAGLVVGGAGRAFWGVQWSVAVQQNVPAEVFNRISAYEILGSVAMLPVGAALAGPVAALVGERAELAAGGVIGLVLLLYLAASPRTEPPGAGSGAV
ncbi:MAG: MFS transporter [Micromonosporaceae bacterium]